MDTVPTCGWWLCLVNEPSPPRELWPNSPPHGRSAGCCCLACSSQERAQELQSIWFSQVDQWHDRISQVTGRLQVRRSCGPRRAWWCRHLLPTLSFISHFVKSKALSSHPPRSWPELCHFSRGLFKMGVWTTPALGEPPEGCVWCLGKLVQDSMTPRCFWGCPVPHTITRRQDTPGRRGCVLPFTAPAHTLADVSGSVINI